MIASKVLFVCQNNPVIAQTASRGRATLLRSGASVQR